MVGFNPKCIITIPTSNTCLMWSEAFMIGEYMTTIHVEFIGFLMYWIICKVMVMNIAYKEPLIKIYKYELILVNLISWIFGYIGL